MAHERWIPLADRAGWEAALRGVPHGFGHTWGAASAMSRDLDANVLLWVCEAAGEVVACPVLERPIADRVDVATAPGSAGFTGTGPLGELPEWWTRTAQTRRYVSGYLAIDPVHGDATYARPAEARSINEAYVMDLRDGIDAVRAGMSTNRRRQVRSWQPGMHDGDREELARFFVDEHPRAMDRKQAASWHRVGRATLDAVCELPDVFLVGARRDGRLESVSVFGHTPHGADFLYNAALPGARQHSVLLLWSAIHRLVALGVGFLNLGGGLRPGDALAEFKARFGAQRRPMRAIRAVYDRPTYEALCRRAGADPRSDGFFPPYRA